MRTRVLLALLALTGGSSLAAQEIRVGTVGLVAERTSTFNGVVGTGNATMLGVELTGRYRFVGAIVRTSGGTFSADSDLVGAGKVATGELRLLAGPRILNADIGYVRHVLDGALSQRSWSFVRIGAMSEFDFGGSGFSGQLSGGIYAKGSGADVESRLIYRMKRFPVYLALGYRRERFVVEEATTDRPEVLSSVLFGGGISIGRR